jgi:hypothetical protein
MVRRTIFWRMPLEPDSGAAEPGLSVNSGHRGKGSALRCVIAANCKVDAAHAGYDTRAYRAQPTWSRGFRHRPTSNPRGGRRGLIQQLQEARASPARAVRTRLTMRHALSILRAFLKITEEL